MSKEIVSIILVISLCLSGCGAQTEAPEIPMAEASIDTGTDDVADDVDLDLTVMSSTLVYGEVYRMMYYPEEYVGKSIRMKGTFSDYFDLLSGNRYFSCIIQDATACCSQGIEFTLTDDYKYPEDYPQDGDDITIEGVFDTYLEDKNMYCTLRDSTLLNY